MIDGRWELETDKLLAALSPDVRMVVINSPNNPTGWTIREDQIEVILSHCRKHGIWLVADDVYQRLIHDPALDRAPSFLARYEDGDRLISINSFSKAWLMTGFRIGWVTAPPPIVAALEKVIYTAHPVSPNPPSGRRWRR